MINSPGPAYPSLTKFTAFVELKDFRGLGAGSRLDLLEQRFGSLRPVFAHHLRPDRRAAQTLAHLIFHHGQGRPVGWRARQQGVEAGRIFPGQCQGGSRRRFADSAAARHAGSIAASEGSAKFRLPPAFRDPIQT